MAYGNKYRIPLKNAGIATLSDSEKLFSIIIQERDFSGAEITLKGNVDGGVLRYLNNEEKKYPEIQASELDILFYSESNFSLEDIITDDDYLYRVLITTGSDSSDFEILWYGFINTDDSSEEMQADPKLIRLRATDGLGYLKNQSLYPISVYEKRTLLTIIQDCLSYITLDIPLLIEVNVFEESMNDRDVSGTSEPFSQCKVHTRSFLKDANSYTDCYSVLVSVLSGFQCSLFQANGMWIIQRKHDRWNQNMNYGTLIRPGKPLNYLTRDYKVKVDRIGMMPIGADQLKGFISAKKYTKITYNYKQPEQIPRNANFKQGDKVLIIAPPNYATTIKYWTYKRNNDTNMPVSPYVMHEIDNVTGNEKEYYVVLPRETNAPFENGKLISEQVEVSSGERLTVTGEYRTKNHIEIYTYAFIHVRLYGNNGTTYTLSKNINNTAYSGDPVWKVGTGGQVQITYTSEDNSEEWLSFQFSSPGFPVDGLVEIWLFNNAPTNGNVANFKTLKFDWTSSIGLIGEFDKITKNAVLRNNDEEEIAIGDAPTKNISGALFKASNDTLLTRNWHRQGKNEFERLIRINDICLHQSTHRLYTKIDGTFLGISYDNKIISPANQFSFTAIPNKYFISTNLEISLGQNTFRASLQEFYDTTKDNGDPQGDTRQFEYIYE